MDIVSFTGHCCPTVKEEPKSPVQPSRKRKAYSTTDASSIGHIKILGSDINTTQPSGKHHKSSSGTSQVQFDGIMVPSGPTAPPTRATRKLTHATKANKKVCVSCLSISDRSLGQLQGLARTLPNFVIDSIQYCYVLTLPMQPSASPVR
jgi:hypothetical protein